MNWYTQNHGSNLGLKCFIFYWIVRWDLTVDVIHSMFQLLAFWFGRCCQAIKSSKLLVCFCRRNESNCESQLRSIIGRLFSFFHWEYIEKKIIFNLSRVTSWLLLSSWLQVELLIPQLQFLDDEGAQAELWELSRLFVDTLIEETGSQVSWKCCFKLNKFSLRVSTLMWW